MTIQMLRSSERKVFKECPQRWWWSAVEGLIPNNVNSGAFWFGSGVHIAMAEYYIPGVKRGRPLEETWREYCKGTHNNVRVETEDGEVAYEKAVELGASMMQYYEKVTQGDPHWEVLSPEQRFKVVVPYRNDRSKPLVMYVGTYDLVIRDLNDGRPKLVDHKTAGALPSQGDLTVLDIDDQAGPYITFSAFSLRREGIIGPRENIRGMEYNFLVKRKEDQRPQNAAGQYLNKDGSVSKVQPPAPFLRHYVPRTAPARKRQIERVQDDATMMALVRSGEAPVLKNTGKDCKFCQFFEMCRVDENGGDIDSMKSLMYHKGDPYADHRDGALNSKTTLANRKKAGVE